MSGIATCPRCGNELDAEFVHNGVGMQQVSPYHCSCCDYVQAGCPADECLPELCASWDRCRGKAKLDEETSHV